MTHAYHRFHTPVRLFGLALIVLAALTQPAQANPRYASIVIDSSTGKVLHESNADKRLHPASLTKVMTLIMVFDQLNTGKMRLNDRIRISRRAAGQVPSKIGLPAGSSIRVRDAIYALVTKSANDIAVAVAEHIGGSESRFAAMMTRRAHELGMSNTQFVNASGLHHKNQISTARDMAAMARYVINTYPKYYAYFSTRNFTYNGHSYHNHNRLMSSYKGMDGMKTGYVAASGFNLIGSAVQGNTRLIGVVFGGRTANSRNAHMKVLLDNSFKKSSDIRMAYVRQVPVPVRKPTQATLLASRYVNKDAIKTIKQEVENIDIAQIGNDFKTSALEEMMGQGDRDPASSARVESGLLSVAAHKGVLDPSTRSAMDVAANSNDLQPAAGRNGFGDPQKVSESNWSIQIGAFTSRAATDEAIRRAVATLPVALQQASPLIMPLKTKTGYLFRARLTGYSEYQAKTACGHIKNCMTVGPYSNSSAI